ncbi:hypothetical protein BC833DRAFT_224079 [Globomyces pollinis-pini]|nr:hypothetical protein BC833DRAFT_224079 [Globomyces pollinis-pini]
MGSGPWTDADTYTWMASAYFATLWMLPLTIEVSAAFRLNTKSIISYISIIVSILKIIYIIIYNHAELALNPAAGQLYKIYKIFDFIQYVMADIALFYRKQSLCRNELVNILGFPFSLDHFVLGICVVVTSIGKTACLIFPPLICWPIEGNFVFATGIISSLYFDIYAMFKLYRIIATSNDIPLAAGLRLVAPIIWTLTLIILNFYGSFTYQSGYATFFSNCMWNVASVIYPIICLQTNVSTSAAMLLVEAKKKLNRPAGVDNNKVKNASKAIASKAAVSRTK